MHRLTGRTHETRHGAEAKGASSHLPATLSQPTPGDVRWGHTAHPALQPLSCSFFSHPVTWNNWNVSFWTETGSNYAKQLEDSQDSKALTLIPTTKMHLCSHRRACASWSGQSCPGERRGTAQQRGSCAPLAASTAPSPEMAQMAPSPHAHPGTPTTEHGRSTKVLAGQFSSSSFRSASGSTQVLQLSPKIKVKWNKILRSMLSM